MALEKDTPPTTAPIPVEPDPDALRRIRERLASEVGKLRDFVAVGAVKMPQKPTFGHNCPGELGSVTYQDADGVTHLAGYVWYACDNYLELTADLIKL